MKLRPATDPGTIHGGDLADAEALAGAAVAEAQDWLELSTGINPLAYPVPLIAAEAWQRLPGRHELDALLAVAAEYYRVPNNVGIVAASGSQALLQLLPSLFAPSRVAVLRPGYGGHQSAWRDGRHASQLVDKLGTADSDVIVLSHPNNPDGRILGRALLREIAARQSARQGWLVIDEAFADTIPEASAVDLAADTSTIIVKSFGKFFGLAGLRLGFMIAPATMAARMRERLGPWTVSGPAIAVGRKALADRKWQDETRAALARRAARLDALLQRAGFAVVGGTTLFRLIETDVADALFHHLIAHRIYVRRFAHAARWLRLGLPGSDVDFDRLAAALARFAAP